MIFYHHSTCLYKLPGLSATLLQCCVYTSTNCSGVARTSRMLGHSMGTLRLYELLQACSPENFLNFTAPRPRSVLKPHRSAVYITYTANSRAMSVRDLQFCGLYVAIPCVVRFQDSLALDSRSTTILSVPIIRMHICTGGARHL